MPGTSAAALNHDASEKACDFVLVSDIAEFKTSKPNKVGGMLRKASGDGNASADVHDARVDYRLYAVGDDSKPKLTSSAKSSSGGFGVASALRVAAFAGSMYMTMGMGNGMMTNMMGPASALGGASPLGGGLMSPGMGAAMSMMSGAQAMGGMAMPGGMPDSAETRPPRRRRRRYRMRSQRPHGRSPTSSRRAAARSRIRCGSQTMMRLLQRRIGRTSWLIVLVLALLPAVVMAIVPVSYPTPALVPTDINLNPGDQFDPHVSGDWVSYTSDLRIRYYNFATSTDAEVPPGSGVEDLLAGVSGSKIVFSRVFLASGTAIMAFDAATPAVAPVEIDPTPSPNRFGAAIGGNTVAYIDFGLQANGELVIHDLVSSSSVRITNDTEVDGNPQSRRTGTSWSGSTARRR